MYIRTNIKRKLHDCKNVRTVSSGSPNPSIRGLRKERKCFMKFTKHLQPQVNPLSNIRKKEKAGEETNNGILGRSFCHRPVLTLYQSTHTQEKPLECNEGGKTFCQNLPFNVHQVTHRETIRM